MTKKERKLLWFAAIMFFGYMIPFEVAPFVWKETKHLLEKVQKQKAEIARLHLLKAEVNKWQQDFETINQQVQTLETSLLSGETRALVSARAQSLLKEYASNAKINLTSVDLPEFVETGDWLLLTQSLKFEANSQQLMDFLQTLQQSLIKFWVVSVDVSVVRANHMIGTLKVSSFSRKVQDEVVAKEKS
ncbi:MAG: hypothetical protein RIT27_1708 [Pseudomonadota bacterium]|jgi:hypothetical protein